MAIGQVPTEPGRLLQGLGVRVLPSDVAWSSHIPFVSSVSAMLSRVGFDSILGVLLAQSEGNNL